MYAIVGFKGNQYKVIKDTILKVPYLGTQEIGSQIEIDDILLISDNNEIKVGTPKIENVKVVAEVISHKRDKKIIVFKKKRRKGYRVKKGHRQDFTEIKIKDIIQ
ncbi:MAG: 50S ribosomal protein L21 [Candidatus Cloacimonas sp.]|jgi:large subunit ribosomal protein L21|nr:50S ribosomal protein L21 [Candidatus Cloacimonadota bacterium]